MQPSGQKNGPLYGRKWKIRIYKPSYIDEVGTPEADSTEVDTAHAQELDVSLLRCVFKCQFQHNTGAALGTLIVYNLNARTEAEVIAEGFQISIFAGYEMGQYGEIFTGDIIQVIRNRENGTDYRLEIIAMRSNFAFPVNHVRTTIAANSTPRKIIEQIARQSDNSMKVGDVSTNISKRPLPRGKVLFGRPEKYLRDICEWSNAWYQMAVGEKNKLEVHTFKDTVPSNMCIKLTPATGLVGTPQYTDNGVAIKMLMEPRVRVDKPFIIKIDNNLIQRTLMNISPNQSVDTNTAQSQNISLQKTVFDKDGEYKVISYTHSGDTYGDEWYTEVIAISRDGIAPLVSLMENESQTMR